MILRRDNMDLNDIKQRAWELKGATSYWTEIRAIKDMIFIFKDWCYNVNYVEDVYAIYTMLTEIVRDIYNDSEKYTDKEKHDFLEWCYTSGIDVSEFIRYTIDCSRGIAETITKVDAIMRKIEREHGL